MNTNPKDVIVFQSNVLTESRFDYSACQLNIFFALLASLQKNDPPDKVYKIYVKEIAALTGNEWNYTRFSDAAKDMQKQLIYMKTERGYKTVSPFDSVEYIDKGGHIEIRIGESARPYFFDLKDSFTAMELKSLLTCSSKHAKRIYAMCCQWQKKGKFVISISALKERLFLKDPEGIMKEQFTEIPALKKYVLDIGKDQMNKNSDLTIDYKLIKKGRAFEDVEFAIKRKEGMQAEIDFTKPMDEQIKLQENLNEIKGYGIREPHLTRIAQAMTDSDRVKVAVKEIVTETMVKFSKQEVTDYAAYIVDALKRKKIIK